MIDLSLHVELGELSPEEVTIILGGITTGSSTVPEKPNVIVYGQSIEVLYKSHHKRILKISVERIFWKKNKAKILEAFHSANNPLSEKIYSRVVFSAGKELPIPPFKWRDAFQLGRLPEGNPQPKYIGSLHPCLFQFKSPYTGKLMLDSHRSQEAFKKLFFPLMPLLRQYCTTHLQCDTNRNIKNAWVLSKEGEEEITSEWLQLGYVLNSSFSSNVYHQYDQPEVKLLPIHEYDCFWLQSIDISTGYSAYECLPKEVKEKFLLGCEWFNKAITSDEPTEQFLFITIMLEIFLPKDKKSCDKCKQSIYGINQKFKTYIPVVIGENWTTDFEQVLGKIYSLRSAIAHGGIAVAQHSAGLIPLHLIEQSKLNYLFDLGRQFLISWLRKESEKH